MLICLVCSIGCTRRFFRRQVDRDVESLLREKDVVPFAKIENMQFYPDPRARFADPFNPDRPPMPPDDPLAKMLGPNPQKPGHAGVANFEGKGYLNLLMEWDAINRAVREANRQHHARTPPVPGTRDADVVRNVAHWQKNDGQPEFKAPVPGVLPPEIVKHKPFLLRVDQAMELGLINSREFQTRREDLYLTALPVTRERFSFSAQWLAIGQTVREWSGQPADQNRVENGWRGSSVVGVSKLFSTGGLLLLAFANETVINFGNPSFPSLTSPSTIHLDMIQPFLRAGGEAVTLEPLTLAERYLLYEVRNYARFRKQFYQYMIGGGDLPTTPGTVSTIGSVAASHALLGTSANNNPVRQQVTPNGLGFVGGSATTGTLFLQVNPSAPSEGFLPTLYKVSELRYEAANVRALSEVLPLFEEYERGGLVSFLQVSQVQLQLLQGRSTVLQKEQALQNSLDAFKAQLGVPMFTQLELEDQPIRPISAHLEHYDGIIEDYKATIKQLDKLDDGENPEKLRGRLEELVRESRLTKSAPQFLKAFPKRFSYWASLKDAKSFNDYRIKIKTRQRALLDLKTERELEGQRLTPDEQRELRILDSDIATGNLEEFIRVYATAPWRKEAREDGRLKEKSSRWRDVRNAFSLLLGDASEERFTTLRPDWAPLAPVVVNGLDLLTSDQEIAYDVVMQTSLENRLDMMNARGQLVDAWRQVKVFANGLLGTFNVAYHMDSRTPPNQAKPLAFQADRTRHQLVMNFELPLVRLTERNAYRASLIAYERTRRDVQQKEDEIANQVRVDIRQLRVLAQNYVIHQQAVELAYKQLESAYEIFTAPQVPDNSPNAAANAAGNAASLTNQLLQAYRGLPQAQEQVAKTWIDYQIARQQLFLDLELMPIDARGVWLDELSAGANPNQLNREQPRQRDDVAATRIPTRRDP